MEGARWTAIVCTCQNRESANAFRKGKFLGSCKYLALPLCRRSELQIRQKKGIICSGAVIMAVDDPKPNIGSGSATLNALISVTEYLAARGGHKVRPVLLCAQPAELFLADACRL